MSCEISENNLTTQQKWNKAHNLRIRELHKRWRDENPERIQEMTKVWNQSERARQYKLDWAKQNRLKVNEQKRLWKLHNPHAVAAHGAKRRGSKLNATPKWLSAFDHRYIQHIYCQARALEKLDGIKRHVDHIVPLVNSNVCGLHVPWNLQILTQEENLLKNNKILEG